MAGRVIHGAMTERTVLGTEVKFQAVMEVSLLAPTHMMPQFLNLVVEGSKAK